MDQTFSLHVKDARTGSSLFEGLTVSGTMSILQFKRHLTEKRPELATALKMHIAHGGRLLTEDDCLEVARATPVVVVALVMPPPTPTPVPPRELQPRRAAAVTQAAPSFRLPAIADAWERAFPGTRDGPPETAARPTAPPAAGATTYAAAAADDDEEEERVCRVCFCGEEAGKLIAPCRCRGSVRLIHVRCLNTWRVTSANPRSFERCETCGFRYRTERTAVAFVLQNERVVTGAAVLCFLLLVFAGALCGPPLVPFRLELKLYNLVQWYPFGYYSWWGARCDALVRGLIVPACGGLYQSITEAYTRHRGLPLEQQGWAIALGVSLANDGLLLARPLLCGGLLYFCKELLLRMRLECRKLFTRFGERVLDVGSGA